MLINCQLKLGGQVEEKPQIKKILSIRATTVVNHALGLFKSSYSYLSYDMSIWKIRSYIEIDHR